MNYLSSKFGILFYWIVNLTLLSSLSMILADTHHIAKRGAPASDWQQRRWPNGKVYYSIDNKLSNIKDEILRAMNEVESFSCVRYIPRTNEMDYVSIEYTENQCLEPVGRQGGKQTIVIEPTDCGNYGFYLHASMQMLGFYHEHQRFDRDNYVDIFTDNVESDYLWAFEKLNSSTHSIKSQYDPDSIMHYGSFQFSKNGNTTLLLKNGEYTKPWIDKDEFSRLDKEAINEYYNCSSSNNSHSYQSNKFMISAGVSVSSVKNMKDKRISLKSGNK